MDSFRKEAKLNLANLINLIYFELSLSSKYI